MIQNWFTNMYKHVLDSWPVSARYNKAKHMTTDVSQCLSAIISEYIKESWQIYMYTEWMLLLVR